MTEDDNTVYVGSKPAMSYVLAVVTQFEEEGREAVHVKARGKTVATAVDVVEMTRNKFLDDVAIDDVSIGTDAVEDDDGNEMHLSSIQIDLRRDIPG